MTLALVVPLFLISGSCGFVAPPVEEYQLQLRASLGRFASLFDGDESTTSQPKAKYTTEHEPLATHSLDHFGPHSKLPNASQQNFIRYNVVPQYITEIPEYGVEVMFKGGLRVDFGNILSVEQISKVPSVSWPEVDDEKYYTLFMIDPDGNRVVVPETSQQYIYWLVGNIPGAQVSKGEILVHYLLPKFSEEYHRFHRVIIVVYYQTEGRRNFSEPLLKKNSMEFRHSLLIHDFTRKYQLHGPVAANFFRLFIPMDDSIS